MHRVGNLGYNHTKSAFGDCDRGLLADPQVSRYLATPTDVTLS